MTRAWELTLSPHGPSFLLQPLCVLWEIEQWDSFHGGSGKNIPLSVAWVCLQIDQSHRPLSDMPARKLDK